MTYQYDVTGLRKSYTLTPSEKRAISFLLTSTSQFKLPQLQSGTLSVLDSEGVDQQTNSVSPVAGGTLEVSVDATTLGTGKYVGKLILTLASGDVIEEETNLEVT